MNFIIEDLSYHFNYKVFTGNSFVESTVFITITILMLFLFPCHKLVDKFFLSILEINLYAIYAMTILLHNQRNMQVVNLSFGQTYIQVYETGNMFLVWLAIENVLMFVPIGFWCGIGYRNKSIMKRLGWPILFSGIFSLLIEMEQYLVRRHIVGGVNSTLL